jgi:hypothetical protein
VVVAVEGKEKKKKTESYTCRRREQWREKDK